MTNTYSYMQLIIWSHSILLNTVVCNFIESFPQTFEGHQIKVE